VLSAAITSEIFWAANQLADATAEEEVLTEATFNGFRGLALRILSINDSHFTGDFGTKDMYEVMQVTYMDLFSATTGEFVAIQKLNYALGNILDFFARRLLEVFAHCEGEIFAQSDGEELCLNGSSYRLERILDSCGYHYEYVDLKGGMRTYTVEGSPVKGYELEGMPKYKSKPWDRDMDGFLSAITIITSRGNFVLSQIGVEPVRVEVEMAAVGNALEIEITNVPEGLQ